MGDTLNIAIVGGGIGGLSLALGLAKAGLRPNVYEQAPQLGEVGAGISLSPNAVKGLRYLGVGGAIDALADEPMHQVTRHFATGETLVDINRAKTREKLGAPYLQMHRADLHRLLHEGLLEAASESIALGQRLERIDKRDDGTYRLYFVDGSNADADVVIGADGLKSTIREQVFGESEPEFSGFVAWRGLLPTEALGDYPLPAGSAVFIAPGRNFVRYPIRLGTVQNFVAFTKADAWTAEGWSQKGDFADFRERFRDFHADVQAILDAYTGTELHRWGLFAREPLPTWVKGRITVLGDAAHPMLPWFGQGAATSIEDAVVLARAIVDFTDIDVALARYEEARRERVTVVHRESMAGGERLTAQDPYALAKNPLRTEDTLGLTEYDPATIAI